MSLNIQTSCRWGGQKNAMEGQEEEKDDEVEEEVGGGGKGGDRRV